MRRKSVFVLVAGIFLAGCALIPDSVYPRPTPTEEIALSASQTPTSIPNTYVPTPTLRAPTASTTRVAETALVETATPAIMITSEAIEQQTLLAASRFGLQAGSPKWLPNFFHPEMGCNFLGIAGQVFGPQGVPEQTLIIEAGGTLGGNDVFALSLTGNDFTYGPGGYELILSDQVLSSNDSVWLQIFNLQGQALSEKIYIDTFADCQRNLVLVNFVEHSLGSVQNWLYLPYVFKNYEAP